MRTYSQETHAINKKFNEKSHVLEMQGCFMSIVGAILCRDTRSELLNM